MFSPAWRCCFLAAGCSGCLWGASASLSVLNWPTICCQGQPEWVILVIALGVGLLGAIASVFLQRIFIVVAGFFAGGYCLSTFAPRCSTMRGDVVLWIAFAVGGLLGAILTVALLDPALIIMSSLAGATAVSQNVPLEPPARTVLFVVLLVLGIAVQVGEYARGAKSQNAAGEVKCFREVNASVTLEFTLQRVSCPKQSRSLRD